MHLLGALEYTPVLIPERVGTHLFKTLAKADDGPRARFQQNKFPTHVHRVPHRISINNPLLMQVNVLVYAGST